MKIMHLSAAHVYGGCEEHIRTLLMALVAQQNKGDEVLLAAPKESPLFESCEGSGVKLIPFEFGGKKDLLAPLRLLAMVSKEQCDVIHSHNRREDLAALLGHGQAAVWTTLHDRINMTQRGERSRTMFDRVYVRILPRFDRVLAVSEATLKDYQELSGDKRPTNSFITNGMDLSRIKGVSTDPGFRKKHGIKDTTFLVVLSARVRHGSFGKKGHVRMLEVLQTLSCPVHLVTVGEDEESSRLLQKEAFDRGVPITTLGFQKNALPLMKQADVVVLPSLFEGLPRALMEAMALGCAVVGSDVDGIRALTDEGRVGKLVGVQNKRMWKKTLEELANNPVECQRLGREASEFIKERFSSERMAKEHWELYRKTV